MKTVNLWKTFLFSALTLAAFTACDNNETEEEGGIPSITVNGGETATVAGTYEECTTEAVEVVSSGSWTLTLSDPSASWCTPSAVSGSKGTTQLTFKLAATTADREITATLTTAGSECRGIVGGMVSSFDPDSRDGVEAPDTSGLEPKEADMVRETAGILDGYLRGSALYDTMSSGARQL